MENREIFVNQNDLQFISIQMLMNNMDKGSQARYEELHKQKKEELKATGSNFMTTSLTTYPQSWKNISLKEAYFWVCMPPLGTNTSNYVREYDKYVGEHGVSNICGEGYIARTSKTAPYLIVDPVGVIHNINLELLQMCFSFVDKDLNKIPINPQTLSKVVRKNEKGVGVIPWVKVATNVDACKGAFKGLQLGAAANFKVESVLPWENDKMPYADFKPDGFDSQNTVRRLGYYLVRFMGRTSNSDYSQFINIVRADTFETIFDMRAFPGYTIGYPVKEEKPKMDFSNASAGLFTEDNGKSIIREVNKEQKIGNKDNKDPFAFINKLAKTDNKPQKAVKELGPLDFSKIKKPLVSCKDYYSQVDNKGNLKADAKLREDITFKFDEFVAAPSRNEKEFNDLRLALDKAGFDFSVKMLNYLQYWRPAKLNAAKPWWICRPPYEQVGLYETQFKGQSLGWHLDDRYKLDNKLNGILMDPAGFAYPFYFGHNKLLKVAADRDISAEETAVVNKDMGAVAKGTLMNMNADNTIFFSKENDAGVPVMEWTEVYPDTDVTILSAFIPRAAAVNVIRARYSADYKQKSDSRDVLTGHRSHDRVLEDDDKNFYLGDNSNSFLAIHEAGSDYYNGYTRGFDGKVFGIHTPKEVRDAVLGEGGYLLLIHPNKGKADEWYPFFMHKGSFEIAFSTEGFKEIPFSNENLGYYIEKPDDILRKGKDHKLFEGKWSEVYKDIEEGNGYKGGNWQLYDYMRDFEEANLLRLKHEDSKAYYDMMLGPLDIDFTKVKAPEYKEGDAERSIDLNKVLGIWHDDSETTYSSKVLKRRIDRNTTESGIIKFDESFLDCHSYWRLVSFNTDSHIWVCKPKLSVAEREHRWLADSQEYCIAFTWDDFEFVTEEEIRELIRFVTPDVDAVLKEAERKWVKVSFGDRSVPVALAAYIPYGESTNYFHCKINLPVDMTHYKVVDYNIGSRKGIKDGYFILMNHFYSDQKAPNMILPAKTFNTLFYHKDFEPLLGEKENMTPERISFLRNYWDRAIVDGVKMPSAGLNDPNAIISALDGLDLSSEGRSKGVSAGLNDPSAVISALDGIDLTQDTYKLGEEITEEVREFNFDIGGMTFVPEDLVDPDDVVARRRLEKRAEETKAEADKMAAAEAARVASQKESLMEEAATKKAGRQRTMYEMRARYTDGIAVTGYHLTSSDENVSGKYTREQVAYLAGRGQISNCGGMKPRGFTTTPDGIKVINGVDFIGKGVNINELPIEDTSGKLRNTETVGHIRRKDDIKAVANKKMLTGAVRHGRAVVGYYLRSAGGSEEFKTRAEVIELARAGQIGNARVQMYKGQVLLRKVNGQDDISKLPNRALPDGYKG